MAGAAGAWRGGGWGRATRSQPSWTSSRYQEAHERGSATHSSGPQVQSAWQVRRTRPHGSHSAPVSMTSSGVHCISPGHSGAAVVPVVPGSPVVVAGSLLPVVVVVESTGPVVVVVGLVVELGSS